MDDYDFTQAMERTILSDSNDPYVPTPAQTSTTIAPNLDIADVWQLVLNDRQLERFEANKFLPTGTRYGIGEGACYRVDRAETNNEIDSMVVAIKYLKVTEQQEMKVDEAESNRSIATVLRELRILTHAPIRKNANIVQLIGYGSRTVGDNISLYLVAEFAAHGTLQDYLRKTTTTVVEKVNFCYGIGKGLGALHAVGIAQGDMKLENTLVCVSATGELVAKLSDFGHSILDDQSRYIGTSIFNPPEVRQGRYVSTLRTDHYKCDIFSFGLIVWEIIQDGRRYVDATQRRDPLSWLDGLPHDDLLRMALLALQDLLPADGAKLTLIQNVLDITLRDDPLERGSIEQVLKIFDSQRQFIPNDSKKNMIPSFDTSQLGIVQRWSLYRSDSNASSVPFPLQKRVFARLQSIVSSCPDREVLGSTLFELSMCYLYGFGVEASTDFMLESLREAAVLKNPNAMRNCHRLHVAFSRTLSLDFPLDHPILQLEHDLQKLPNDEYFSARIRGHEKLFQQTILDVPFDLFSGESLMAKDVNFSDMDRIADLLARDDLDVSTLVAVSSLTEAPDLGPLLHFAARLGQLKIVELLVEAGTNVDFQWNGCGTPVTAACRGGHSKVVKYLVYKKATTVRVGNIGPSPMHWMIMFEPDEIEPMARLVKRTIGNIDKFSNEAVEFREHSIRMIMSALHFASFARYRKLTDVLISHMAIIRGTGAATPLDIAVSLGFPEITETILKADTWKGSTNPLIHSGLANTLQTLLQHGSSARSAFEATADLVLGVAEFSEINVVDKDGYTPLDLALTQCSCELNLDELEVLIERGAVLKMTERTVILQLGTRNDERSGRIMRLLLDTGRIKATPTLLCSVCLYGDENILQALLDFGIDVNEPTVEEGGSMVALLSSVLVPGTYQVVKMLLDYGADINVRAFGQHSVLEMAVMQPIGDGDVIDLLIDRGIDVMSVAKGTILHVAARLHSKVNGPHVLFHLLRHDRIRALVNFVSADATFETPLIMGCAGGDIEAIDALVEAGATVVAGPDYGVAGSANPAKFVELLGRQPELSPQYKQPEFNLEKYLLRAERTIMMLLDKGNPGHGRTPLHVAVVIGNYERVVALVESGANVWAGDAEKKTPLGLLDYDAGDPNLEPEGSNLESLERYTQNCQKIEKYLEIKMMTVAGEVSSLEEVKDLPFKIKEFPVEDDTPDLMLVGCTKKVEDLRKKLGENHPQTLIAIGQFSDAYQLFAGSEQKSEDLEMELLGRRKEVLSANDPDLFESLSSEVRIMLNHQKLEEARHHANEALRLAITHFGEDHHVTVIAHVNISLVDAAEGKFAEATEAQEKNLERLLEVDGYGPLHRDSLMLNVTLAHYYAGLGRWEEFDEKLQYMSRTLEYVKKELIPEHFTNLVVLAQSLHNNYRRYKEAQSIYEKLAEDAKNKRGEYSYYYQRCLELLVTHFSNQSQFKEASEIQIKLVDISKKRYGLHHRETHGRMSELAKLYEDQTRWLEAHVLRQQVVDLSTSMSGATDEHTLLAKSNMCNTLHQRGLFIKGVELAREVVEGYKSTLGDANAFTISAENRLALLINSAGNSAEAAELQEQVVESLIKAHGENHDKVASALINLGAIYLRDARIDDGEREVKRVLAIQEALYGVDSLQAGTSLSYLAGVYLSAGKREEACKYHEQALAIERKFRGNEAPETLYLMPWLADDYFALGMIDKATDLQIELLSAYRKLKGDEHNDTLQAMYDLGTSYQNTERGDEAEKLYFECLAGRRKVLGDSNEHTLVSLEALSFLYVEAERWDDATPLAYEAFVRAVETFGKDHERSNAARMNLVTLYRHLEQWADVEELQREIVEILTKDKGAEGDDTIEAMDILSEAYEWQGKHKECEPLNIAVLKHRRKTLGSDNERSLNAMDHLIDIYLELKKYSEAATLREEALEIHLKLSGEESEEFISMKAKLATVYWHLKRFSDAEALEISVMETRMSALGPDDAVTHEAMEALAKTYIKQSRFDEALALHACVLESQQKVATSHLDPYVLTSTKHIEDVYFAKEDWSEAKAHAQVLLDAMRELGVERDTNGVLSALSDMRKIVYRMGDKEELKEMDSLCIKERLRKGLRWGGTGKILDVLSDLKDD